jgi:glutamine amidotransferase
MANMHKLGLFPLLNDRVINRKIPILGICLGMQLMTKKSEEGALPGFGWVDAATVRFKFGQGQNDLKIPHMGWNTVKIRKEAEFFKAIIQEPRFYFVHSYHVVCANETDIWTTTFHGYEFVSAFLRDNIAGVQFHPEKSHKMGLAFLRAWAMS